MKAVDDALVVLCRGVRDTVYYHIDKKFQLEPERFYDKISSFQKSLESIFGEGSIVVEHSIANKLYLSLGLNFTKRENWRLLDYVGHAKEELKLVED